MATSPEVRPRVSVTTDYDVPPMRAAAAESRKDRLENRSNNSIGYALGVLVLIVAGYFAYTYYGSTNVVPSASNQSSTTVAPPVVVAAPSATAPAAPATTPATKTTP